MFFRDDSSSGAEESLFTNLPFVVNASPVIPIMVATNRFILSPIEFHLWIKILQYDPWYERRGTGLKEKIRKLR